MKPQLYPSDQIPRHIAAKILLERRQARNTLLGFVQFTHDNWTTNWHHRQICDALEAVERGEIKRLIIEAPPRTGKSEIVSRKFPAWYLGRNRHKHIMCLSYSDDLSTEFGRDVKYLLRSDEYAKVFPNVQMLHDASAAMKWRTNNGCVYNAAGIRGRITGKGADLLIIDDPHRSRADAESVKIRENVWSAYDGDIRTRLHPGAAIIVMCTRWHEEDLIGKIAQYHDDQGWTRLTFPAIANEGTDDEQALWPERFSLEEMQDLRASYMASHPRDWYSLYQQRPKADQGTYCRREWFVDRYKPGETPDMAVYMASDFAVTEAEAGRDPDWTEHAVFGVDKQDNLYVLDWWSGQCTADVWIESLLDLISQYKPLAWFGEKGVIRRAIEPALIKRSRERKVYCRLEWLTRQGGKDQVGRAFQARAAMGKVRFPLGHVWAQEVIEQCVGFPSTKHDDKFDAMSLMCLAIDQAHPAIKHKPQTKQGRRGLYGRGGAVDNWKVN